MGQSFWNTSSIKNGKENVDNLIESIALHLARVNVEGLKFIFLSKFVHRPSIDLNHVNPSVVYQGFRLDMDVINFCRAHSHPGSSV